MYLINIIMNAFGYIVDTIVTKNQNIDMMVEKTLFDLQAVVYLIFH